MSHIRTNKERVWTEMLQGFLKEFPQSQFTIDQLRDRYRNLKAQEARKIDAANQKRTENAFKALGTKTGGGKAPEPLPDISIEDDDSIFSTYVTRPDWGYRDITPLRFEVTVPVITTTEDIALIQSQVIDLFQTI